MLSNDSCLESSDLDGKRTSIIVKINIALRSVYNVESTSFVFSLTKVIIPGLRCDYLNEIRN